MYTLWTVVTTVVVCAILAVGVWVFGIAPFVVPNRRR
jgi:hypothetical protein